MEKRFYFWKLIAGIFAPFVRRHHRLKVPTEFFDNVTILSRNQAKSVFSNNLLLFSLLHIP